MANLHTTHKLNALTRKVNWKPQQNDHEVLFVGDEVTNHWNGISMAVSKEIIRNVSELCRTINSLFCHISSNKWQSSQFSQADNLAPDNPESKIEQLEILLINKNIINIIIGGLSVLNNVNKGKIGRKQRNRWY